MYCSVFGNNDWKLVPVSIYNELLCIYLQFESIYRRDICAQCSVLNVAACGSRLYSNALLLVPTESQILMWFLVILLRQISYNGPYRKLLALVYYVLYLLFTLEMSLQISSFIFKHCHIYYIQNNEFDLSYKKIVLCIVCKFMSLHRRHFGLKVSNVYIFTNIMIMGYIQPLIKSDLFSREPPLSSSIHWK